MHCVCDYVQHGGVDTASPEASPVRSSCASCLNTAAVQQHSIISMEEDEMSDQEVVSICLLRCLFISNETVIHECLSRAVNLIF
jgi:hypothetical protein